MGNTDTMEQVEQHWYDTSEPYTDKLYRETVAGSDLLNNIHTHIIAMIQSEEKQDLPIISDTIIVDTRVSVYRHHGPQRLAQQKLYALAVVALPAHLVAPSCFPLFVNRRESTEAAKSSFQRATEVHLPRRARTWGAIRGRIGVVRQTLCQGHTLSLARRATLRCEVHEGAADAGERGRVDEGRVSSERSGRERM